MQQLNSDPDNRPAVIAIDVPLYGRSVQESDDALVQALQSSDNVMLTSMLQFNYRLVHQFGRFSTENMRVSGMYRAVPPLDMLPAGYANLVGDSDRRIRHGLFAAKYDDQIAHSFPYQIYSAYSRQGDRLRKPPMNLDGMWLIDYRGKPESFYTDVTWESILSGEKVPTHLENKIVLLCADLDSQMRLETPLGLQTSTEITANMVQGLLQPYHKREIPMLFQALVILPLTWVCSLLTRKGKWISLLTAGSVWFVWPMGCMLLYHMANIAVDPFYLPLFVTILSVCVFASKFLTQTYRRFVTWLILRRYLPIEMRKRLFHEDISLEKAQKRNIAVLFVDIRGFTPLSESLAPSHLVQVLKEYLTLTSGAIFSNGGTLDKFIGDATMGFFNAPLDQEDYVYYAVRAAMDIVQGGQKVRDVVRERFGCNIHFGVGVHCGDALVGMIGSDYRKDYTAVGDTVNTAARLESNAKSGEVLVSMKVCEVLKGRIEASFVGELPIKGKSQTMMLYRVDKLLKTPLTPS